MFRELFTESELNEAFKQGEVWQNNTGDDIRGAQQGYGFIGEDGYVVVRFVEDGKVYFMHYNKSDKTIYGRRGGWHETFEAKEKDFKKMFKYRFDDLKAGSKKPNDVYNQ